MGRVTDVPPLPAGDPGLAISVRSAHVSVQLARSFVIIRIGTIISRSRVLSYLNVLFVAAVRGTSGSRGGPF